MTEQDSWNGKQWTQGKILLLSLLAERTSLFYQIPDSIWILSKVVIFDWLDASKQTVPIKFTRPRWTSKYFFVVHFVHEEKQTY